MPKKRFLLAEWDWTESHYTVYRVKNKISDIIFQSYNRKPLEIKSWEDFLESHSWTDESERFSERLHNLIRKEDSVAIQVIDLFKLSINKVSVEARLFDGEEEKRFRDQGF